MICLKLFPYQLCRLCAQEIDYGNNTKTNDADINNFLYSDDGPGGAGGQYSLPADTNEPASFFQQPDNMAAAGAQQNQNPDATAADRRAKLQKYQEQARLQYQKKKTQFGVVRQSTGEVNLGQMKLKDMNLDRQHNF